MKRIHLLRFAGDPGALGPLLEAARSEGLRVGWLEVPGEEPVPVPPRLDAAASAGAFRSVAVGAHRTVAVKRRAGAPALQDLLREHFLGCALVVVRVDRDAAGRGDETAGAAAAAGPLVRDAGAALDEAPWLKVEGDAFVVEPPGRAGRRLTAAELAARLRKPRPWE